MKDEESGTHEVFLFDSNSLTKPIPFTNCHEIAACSCVSFSEPNGPQISDHPTTTAATRDAMNAVPPSGLCIRDQLAE